MEINNLSKEINTIKASVLQLLEGLKLPTISGKIRQYKGLLIECSIHWNKRENYDIVADGDKDDYASIEVWYNNGKNRNDPSGRIGTKAYRKKVGEELWRAIKYEYNNNRNYHTFYSIKVDENNEVLDFKREKELEQLVNIGRSAGGSSQEVFLL